METIHQEAALFKAARKKISDTRLSNKPIRERNVQIRKQNERISALNEANNTNVPHLPYEKYNDMPKDALQVIKRDTRQRKLLTQRSELEWLQLLESKFRGKLFQKIACIIWWDFADNKKGNDRWTRIEQLIDASQRIDIDRDTKVQALHSLGYPAHAALTRIPS